MTDFTCYGNYNSGKMQTLRNRILLLLVIITSAANAQKQEAVSKYISEFKDLAVAEMKRTGVPAAITLAQGIHESGAGTSKLDSIQ